MLVSSLCAEPALSASSPTTLSVLWISPWGDLLVGLVNNKRNSSRKLPPVQRQHLVLWILLSWVPVNHISVDVSESFAL